MTKKQRKKKRELKIRHWLHRAIEKELLPEEESKFYGELKEECKWLIQYYRGGYINRGKAETLLLQINSPDPDDWFIAFSILRLLTKKNP